MQKIIFATLMTAGALLASSASAQTFTGPRIEGRVGADSIGLIIQDTRDFNGRGEFGNSSRSTDFSFGGEVGFDVQAGNLVFGGYAGADFPDVQETLEQQGVTFNTGRNLTAGVRGGVLFNPAVLGYGKVGYSNSRLRTEFTNTTTQTLFRDFENEQDGIHFGGGVEVALAGGAYVRADYTHTRYDEFDVDANREFRFTRNQFFGGIGFRF